MVDAVFFDTNRIRNEHANCFFGGIEKISRIANVAQVFIPSIVMDEIKQQKLRKLEQELATFKDNYFTKHLSINVDGLERHIDEKITELYEGASDEASFVEYHLKDSYDHIHTLKFLALKNHPPFCKGDGNDKGFKDSIIYLSIKQYLEENADKRVFLFTNDGRLKEAFDDNNRVQVLNEFDDYFNYRKGYFYEDYFIGKLREHFGTQSLTASSIIETELTDDDDWRMVVRVPVVATFEASLSDTSSLIDEPFSEVEFEDIELIIDFTSREIVEVVS